MYNRNYYAQVDDAIAQADRTIQGDERYTPDYAVYPLLEFLGDKKKGTCLVSI